MIAEIVALLEQSAFRPKDADRLKLRRANRVRTIQASLAIEGNHLSEEQVSEILHGKRVTAPLRQIQEVKNAIAVYDIAEKLNPYSVDDLLRAHGMMMAGLMERPGEFRWSGAAVAKKGKVIHMAPPAHLVPKQMEELFFWLRNAADHPLIKSCVFHYEFEFIHPFTDGNGRIGRLWQSLILGKWNPIFLQLPVETMVHNDQNQYYRAINESSTANDSGFFIDFMLRAILSSLHEHPNCSNNATNPAIAIFQFIQDNPGIRAGMIAEKLSVSRRTVERYLKELKQMGKIEFRGAPRNGGYYPK